MLACVVVLLRLLQDDGSRLVYVFFGASAPLLHTYYFHLRTLKIVAFGTTFAAVHMKASVGLPRPV